MTDEQILNLKLKLELENPVYDIVDEAINYTIHKQKFQKYDLVKLVMLLYKKDYSCLSNTNDYREQVKLLDEYFEKEYDHSIITFIMIKAILAYKNTDKYGILEGLKLGAIFILIMIIIKIITNSTFDIRTFIYSIIIILTTSIGSIIGINKLQKKP